MINGLDNWQCPECGYIPEGMMDVVDTPDGEHDGSVCPACKVFVPTERWIILSEDELYDALGFGGMDELDYDDSDEYYEDPYDRDYADYEAPDDSGYPGADAADMMGDV